MQKILALIFTLLFTTPAFSGGVFKGGSQAEIDYINSMPLEDFLDILAYGLTSMAPTHLDNSTSLMNAIRLQSTLIVNYQFNESGAKKEWLESTPKDLPETYLNAMFYSKEYDDFYKELFWEIQKNGLCSNPGLSLALTRGANVIYSYTDLDNNELFQLSFDKNDCSKPEIPLDIMWRDFFLNYFNSHNPYQ